MKIVIVTNVFPPQPEGGCAILAQQLTSSFSKRGHQVFVLCPKEVKKYLIKNNCDQVFPLLFLTSPFPLPPKGFFLKRLWVFRKNYKLTNLFLLKLKPDFLFLINMGRMSLAPAYAAKDLNIPYLFSINDSYLAQYAPTPKKRTDLKGRTKRFLEVKCFPRLSYQGLNLNQSISISNQAIRTLCNMGIPVEKAKTIYQGIPLDLFPFQEKEKPFSDATIKLLFIGNFLAYKGPQTLIKAISYLKNVLPDWDVQGIFVGDGPEKTSLLKTSHALGIKDNCKFLGWTEHHQLKTIYHKADIFVFPSICEEGFGLTFLEAMACGTPVVSTATGGNKEFLKHGNNCLLFEPKNSRGLATHIITLLKNRTIYTNLSRNAAKEVHEHFSLDSYTASIEQTLRSIT